MWYFLYNAAKQIALLQYKLAHDQFLSVQKVLKQTYSQF